MGRALTVLKPEEIRRGCWLEGFAYRIQIGPGVFVMTAAIILLIALASISAQIINAAEINPVKSLRSD